MIQYCMHIRIADGGVHSAGSTWGLGWRFEPLHKIYLPLRGRADYHVEREDGSESSTQLTPGSVVIIPGNFRHRVASKVGFQLAWLHFSISEPLADALITSHDPLVVLADENSPWSQVFEGMDPSARGPRTDSRLLSRVTSLLYWALADLHSTEHAGRAEDIAHWRHRLAPVSEAIRRSLASPPRVPELAKRVGLSVRQLQRGLLNAWGVSPRQFIEDQRLNLADELLLSAPNMNIGEIARACGYADPFHFSRAFRRRRGRSPEKFRNHASSIAL